MGARRFVLHSLFLVGCGGGGSGDKPDAAVDAPTQIDGPVTPGCAYTESADGTNNTSPSAEATNVTAPNSICGSVNNGHFNMNIVDIDTYKVTVAADSDLLVNVTGTGLSGLARVVIQVGSTAGMQKNLGIVEGDHGTVSVRLAPGDYVFAVTGLNAADITAPIDYKIAIVTDTPATRCAKVTAAANFTEANDGGQNNGNDVLSVDEAANPATRLTASTTDAPEPSNVTANAGTNYRITGSSAAVDPADDYEDRDTFLLTTGATTNQLSVRLNWASTTVDFDYKFLPAGSTISVTGGLATANTEDEFQTFAVKPNTMYWLWIGAYDGATGQPAIYDATICAEAFTP